MPYADADYEYFEQRQLPARPQVMGPGHGLQQPLLRQEKPPHEETLYAEPILVCQPQTMHPINISNPLGEKLLS